MRSGKQPQTTSPTEDTMTTIRTLAAEYSAQPYEIAAALDLGTDYDETAEIAPADETWMREALEQGRKANERD